MTVTAVLFDLGGTLLHYIEPHTTFLEANLAGLTAMHGFLRRAGYRAPAGLDFANAIGQFARETHRPLEAQGLGACVDDTFRQALSTLGINVTDADWPGALWCYYGAIQRFVLPVAGDAVGVLRSLSAAGLRLGLISNTWWSHALHDADLGRAGMLEYLPVRIYSSQAGFMKPRAEIFQQALVAMGIRAEEAIYVGDRLLVDVGGAQAAGLRGVLIEVDHRVEQSADVRAAARLRLINELPALLDQWQRE